MPQTKFVLRKAFACHIRPIVVINKIDRPDARPDGGPQRGLRHLRRARGQRGAARLPVHLRLGQGRLRLARPDGHLGGRQAAVRPDRRAGPGPGRRSATARSGCSARRSTSPSTSAGSPSAGSPRAVVRREQKAILLKAGGVSRPRLDRQRPGVRQARADRGPVGRGRRHRRDRRAGQVDIGDTIADAEPTRSPCPGSRSTSRP